MSRYTLFAVIAALCLATSSATVTTASLTTASFSAPPGVVFQGATGAADVATWGTYAAAIYGPGTANTTVYAYGFKGTAPITAVASRSLNATRLNNGTAATASTDALLADVVSGTVSYATGYKYAVGLGSIAIAYVAADSATVPCNQVYLAVYTGGTAAAVTTKLTSATCVLCATGTAGAGFGYTIHNVFYENSTYYVAYTTLTYATTASSSAPCTGAATAAPTGVAADTSTTALSATLQGYSPAGTAKWTTAPTWYTVAAAAAPVTAYTGMCGPQNYTNSTTFYCAYSNGASPTVLSYIPITVSSGAAGSASTLATSTAVSGTAAQSTKTYTIAGFLHSQYQQGILLNLLTTTYTSGPTVSTYANTLQLYNFTSGASSTTGATDGGIAVTGYSNTYSGGAYSYADGVTYGLGFGLVTAYMSDASTTNYQIGAFFANGTANGTAPTTFSTGGAYSTSFVDANGALWAGGYSVDTTLQTGTLGQLVAQIYYSAGNVLASFVALLSLMIAALFAF